MLPTSSTTPPTPQSGPKEWFNRVKMKKKDGPMELKSCWRVFMKEFVTPIIVAHHLFGGVHKG